MTDRRIAEVNYDGITENFIEFLKGQDTLKDFDFEASGIRQIISLLSYHLHYQNFYANASFKERFLDSAVLRSSVVANAKRFGYTPRSIRASSAIVDVRLENGSNIYNNVLQLPKGSRFKGTTRDRKNVFDFVTTEDYTTLADDVDVTFENVELVQGNYSSFDFRINSFDQSQRLELPTRDIDTRYLEIYVQEGSDVSRLEQYTLANDTLSSPNDRVYWLEEGPSGRFRIFFGDDLVGKSVGHGKIVRALYIKTQGVDANNVSEFTYTSSNTTFSEFLTSTFSSINVSTLSKSQGGDYPEGIESIRFRAPRYKASGGNATRLVDYEEKILENFSEVLAVRTWDASSMPNPAGEVGKIFISAVPRNGEFFTKARKIDILNELQRSTAGAGKCFEFVDPCYIYPKIYVTLRLDDKAIEGLGVVKEKVIRDLLKLNRTDIQAFQTRLNRSDIICTARDASDAIVSALVDVKLQVRLRPFYTKTVPYHGNINNPVLPGTFKSTEFSRGEGDYYITDNGAGKLILNDVAGGPTEEVGTIDYENGVFDIVPLNIDAGTFHFEAGTPNKDITTTHENILRLERNCIFVTAEDDLLLGGKYTE